MSQLTVMCLFDRAYIGFRKACYLAQLALIQPNRPPDASGSNGMEESDTLQGAYFTLLFRSEKERRGKNMIGSKEG